MNFPALRFTTHLAALLILLASLAACSLQSEPAPLVQAPATTPPPWSGGVGDKPDATHHAEDANKPGTNSSDGDTKAGDTSLGTTGANKPGDGTAGKPGDASAPAADNKPGDGTAGKPGDASAPAGDNKSGDGATGNAEDSKPGTTDNKSEDGKPGDSKPGTTADKPGASGNKPEASKPGDSKPGDDKPGNTGTSNGDKPMPDTSKPSEGAQKPSANPKPPSIASTVSASLTILPSLGGQPVPAFGACIDFVTDSTEKTSFQTMACNAPHKAQVVGYVDLTNLPAQAPGVATLNSIAGVHCKNLGDAFIKQKMSDRGGLAISWTAPTKAQWAAGARTMVCMITGMPTGAGIQTAPLEQDLKAP